MRKAIALKTLLRAPVKTILTFLLIAAASFALFSHVTDYAVTTRETANAESFFSGVASLDNTVAEMVLTETHGNTMFSTTAEAEDKPWPTEKQLKEFISLPGVTLADTRYMTAGRVEDYRRLADSEWQSSGEDEFVIEGTYLGYEQLPGSDGTVDTSVMELLLGDVKVLTDNGEKLMLEEPFKVSAYTGDELTLFDMPYPRTFFEELKKGTRCLIVADGRGVGCTMGMEEESFHILDGAGEDYLETEEFAYYKGMIEAINQNMYTYDIVYTSDMRAIPRYNERSMLVTEGRPLTAEDKDACVVNKYFLTEHNLSVGDKIHVQLGDRLFTQTIWRGAQASDGKTLSNFGDSVELEIIGAYENMDDLMARLQESEWCYPINTIFVSSELLPVKIPDDHELSVGEFSVLIKNARDIEAFRDTAEPLVAEMGINMRFSDGGWLNVKDSFETGSVTSLLTTILYVIGAALALFLAGYLYIGRSKKMYAIMRTLGVPGKNAANSVVLPLAALSIAAIPVGGITGLIYASDTAEKTLADMADSAPYGYVPDATLPVGVIVLCLCFELAFIAGITLLFLRKMKRIPSLELLQEGAGQTKAGRKAAPEVMDTAPVPAGLDVAKISEAGRMRLSSRRKYNAVRHVSAYLLRHMRRGVGRTVLALSLTVVLTAGIGLFVMAQLTYKDAFDEMKVTGRALNFSPASVKEFGESFLMEDFYCYGKFDVRVNGESMGNIITFTNNIERYFQNVPGDYEITYADGYDESFMESTEPLCLVGKAFAEEFHVQPGEEITLLSESMYKAMCEVFADDEASFSGAMERNTVTYKIAGVIECDDMQAGEGIFAGINGDIERVYGQPFPFEYGEFTVARNRLLRETNNLLRDRKQDDAMYTKASWHIDDAGLKSIERIQKLLDSLFPIAVGAVLLIGLFGPELIILQSAREAAFLRILGVTKKRARSMLVLEQLLLCVVGIVLVTGGLVLYDPGRFSRGIQTLITCFALYLLVCVCGAFVAAVQVTRHKVLELLQVKE